MLAFIAGLVIGVGVGGYFGYRKGKKWIDAAKKKADDVKSKFGG